LWTRDRSDFDAVNNEGTRNVLHEALRAGAERVLHTSTESILVCAQSSDQSVEELRLTDEIMIGPYCLSKLKGEQEAFRLADSFTIPFDGIPNSLRITIHHLKASDRALVIMLYLPQNALNIIRDRPVAEVEIDNRSTLAKIEYVKSASVSACRSMIALSVGSFSGL
jgi:hypothetical protein